MAVSQVLTLTEVAGSPSVANNTSRVQIKWTSTQTGTSYNLNTRTAKYWVSINGGAATEYAVSYTLPKGTTTTILDTTITVPHRDDGSGTITVATWMDTRISAGVVEKSQSLTLTTIARASAITSAANVTLGNACSVSWTPNSTAFRYKLRFSLGSWNYTTGAIHPNKTSSYTYTGYTIPIADVAKQILNSFTGRMTVTLYTYSNSGATTQVGSADSETFTVTVPTSEAPIVSMSLSPVHTLPEQFNGLYIQGLSKVKAALSADALHDATIKYYNMAVEGKTYGADEDYTSGYLTNSGTISVSGHAVDSRDYGGYTPGSVVVIPYANPKIQNVTATRCDASGNPSDGGTYLKITAKRSYYPVVSNDVQKNFCEIRYRYKVESDRYYSDWVTILAGDNLSSDEVVTGPLLAGNFLATNTYQVEVQAIDDVGKTATSTIVIPTDKVYWHRDGVHNALGLGKYNEKENALDSAWDFYMNGNKITGLPIPVDDTDAVPKAYAAPADVQMKRNLNAIGWYKIGIITANMCSVITLTIGGVFQNNQASPAVVDIATQYNDARIHTILPSTVSNQISHIGVIIEGPKQFGVYAYYNSAKENPVHINVHPSMGTFQSTDWVISTVSDGDMAAAVALNVGLLTNCIVEEGTNGIWKYRKWSDGTAECRGIHVQNNVAVTTAWGYLYESPGYVVDLPSGLFKDTPQFSITLSGGGGAMLETYSKGSATQTPHMCVVRPTAVTIDTVNTSIVAYGRWK